MRSSTVKVHMKTHEGETEYPEIEIKVSKPPNAIEEEKSFPPNFVPIKLEYRSEVPEKQIKNEIISKPDNQMFKPIPSKSISPPAPQSPVNNGYRLNGFLRPQYSVTATITSSRENIFDAPSNRTPQIQIKKYPMILPSLPSINRLNTKESCLLNKSIYKGSDRCLGLTTPALNHLSQMILQQDPLA
jgi:hypothetical protein